MKDWSRVEVRLIRVLSGLIWVLCTSYSGLIGPHLGLVYFSRCYRVYIPLARDRVAVRVVVRARVMARHLVHPTNRRFLPNAATFADFANPPPRDPATHMPPLPREPCCRPFWQLPLSTWLVGVPCAGGGGMGGGLSWCFAFRFGRRGGGVWLPKMYTPSTRTANHKINGVR